LSTVQGAVDIYSQARAIFLAERRGEEKQPDYFGAAGWLGKVVSHFLGYAGTPSEIILIDLPDKIELLIVEIEF